MADGMSRVFDPFDNNLFVIFFLFQNGHKLLQLTLKHHKEGTNESCILRRKRQDGGEELS